MTPTILIVADEELVEIDVEHILSLEDDLSPVYHVLIPADTERNIFVSLLDHLLLGGGVREAWEVMREDEPTDAEARASAQDQLEASLSLLRARGATCEGSITADDPLPALRKAVEDGGGDVISIIIVARPLAVEDTFRQDWASKAREILTVPVLRIYRGTDTLG